MKKLVEDINAALGEQRLPEPLLNKAFEKNWPDFEAGIVQAQRALTAEMGGHSKPKRTTEAILAEMLDAQKGTLKRLDAMENLLAAQIAAQGPGLGLAAQPYQSSIFQPNAFQPGTFGGLPGISAHLGNAGGTFGRSLLDPPQDVGESAGSSPHFLRDTGPAPGPGTGPAGGSRRKRKA